MADDPQVGSSPASFRAAADEITSVNGSALGYSAFAERVKLDYKGVDGQFWDVSPTTPLPVDGGVSAVPSASFTRPATTPAYAIGNLLANSATAGSVTPLTIPVARVNGGSGSIVRGRLSTTKTGLAGTEIFRVHLFKNSPTVANGDGGNFSVSNGRASGYLGYIDVPMTGVFGDGATGIAPPAIGPQIVFTCASGSVNIYGLIEARTTYTGGSGETWTFEPEVLRD